MKLFIILLGLLSYANTVFSIVIIQYPVLSERKMELLNEYAQRHYNLKTANLYNPTMVVLHYTGVPSFRFSLNQFKIDELDPSTEKLAPYGLAPLGTHYLIDFDGSIYELVPSTVMVRHVIGYDYTSISIQNVGTDASYLTEEQLEANAELINYLHYKHPSIRYVIGHMEYMNTTYAHYKLHMESDEELRTPVKIDPGWNFLEDVRGLLKKRYSLEFQK